jgi:adenylate cyclase
VRQPPRKLTVLASIDVAGYTRMVQRDERKTLGQLAAVRRDILDPLIATYNGDMFKTMGDGGLIEFPSVEDSVRWAIDYQTAMAEHNKGRGEDALNVRLAIALADVVVADGDRYGAAVAFTVRLQEAAPPGASSSPTRSTGSSSRGCRTSSPRRRRSRYAASTRRWRPGAGCRRA